MEFTQLPKKMEERLAQRGAPVSPRIIIIGALVVLCLVVAGILLVRYRQQMRSVQEEVDEVTKTIQSTCTTDECALRVGVQAANTARDVRICSAVESSGESITQECIWQYASSSGDASACDQLQGDVRNTCSDHVFNKIALKSGDIEECAQIKNQDLQRVCIFDLLPTYVRNNDCQSTGVYRSSCEAQVNERFDIARQVGVDLCAPFEAVEDGDTDSPDYQICLEVLDTVDLDGDTLTIRQEIEAGTDNQNKDTDGDGFDDGTEVNNGYNPLGQ